MRKCNYYILSFILLILLPCSFQTNVSAKSHNYLDVSVDSYYYSAVRWASENNVTNGTSENTFSPDDLCTRSQVVTFLWRVGGCPTPSIDNPFIDITDGTWYYDAVLWAFENGITNGYGSGDLFNPDGVCTRSEIVTFLWRFAGSPESNGGAFLFSDVTKDAWYYSPVVWAVENGITYGIGDNKFEPLRKCSRAEAITFIWRACIQEDAKNAQVNSAEYGLSSDNSGLENSIILQSLIDTMIYGGTIYIPSGEYMFAEMDELYLGSRCIKMRSNISIIGAGDTVLMPVGESNGGLNMFYFNDLVDSGIPNYLENCSFENFTIDSCNTSTNMYTSAGKGFMFNLYKNCRWNNVIVKNTDGTGFGMDCPIDCSMANCVAINCGKAATRDDGGASGFGIGFGYAENENMIITNCYASGNMKFGFFFEHQGIYTPSLYRAEISGDFVVQDCAADENYYNYGGISAMNVTYEDCISKNHIKDGFYFEDSVNCNVINCIQQ